MSDVTNTEEPIVAETTETVAGDAVVDAPPTDVTNETREARRGGRERNPNRDRGARYTE